VQTPYLDVFIGATTLLMLVGWVWALVTLFKQGKTKEGLLALLVPFWVFRSILKMPDGQSKKLLAISTMGAFFVFFVASVIKIIMTPPM
jgi:hypothetical protein